MRATRQPTTDGAVNVSEYPGRPIVKRPLWTWEVPAYFFVGGLAGAAATLAAVAEVAGEHQLARRARLAAAAGALVGAPLLISDLGRPERFLNMLRVFRPTSPMSIGTWTLATFGSSAALSVAGDLIGVARPLGRLAGVVAGILGPVLTTYTGVLVGQTSVPVWERARAWLPFLFAGSSAASAGALVAATVDPPAARPAQLMAVGGAVAEALSELAMERSLGEAGVVYRTGRPGRFRRLALELSLAGAGLVAAGLAGSGRRRLTLLGCGAVLAGSLSQRIAIWAAGPASAARTGVDPDGRGPR
ncbi:MAG TPA: NrfD/PsrC family molybdoenzyme membrane anchor subunit [Candidatus Dormibacteraeota bacterium]|nr:NrfD/PsrC family molybdoenzyme membrane anchor subunit [Candidatus Dormibacteraeota bacterium]